MLGPELLGNFTLGFSIFSFAVLLSQLGLDAGVIPYLASYSISNDKGRILGVILQGLFFPFIIGSVIAFIIYINSGWLSLNLFKKPDLAKTIEYFSFGVPFMASMTVAAAIARSFYLIKLSVLIINIFQPFFRLFFILLLMYFFGYKLSGAVLANDISVIFAFIIAIFYVSKIIYVKLNKVKVAFEVSTLLNYSLILFLTSLAGFIFMWSDIIILGYLRPNNDVGVYRVMAQIGFIFTIITSSFSAASSPVLAEVYQKKEISKLSLIMKAVTKSCFAVSMPLGVFILAAPIDVLKIFGPQYIYSSDILVILILSQLLIACLGEVGWPLVLCGHQKTWFYINVLMAVFNIAFNYYMINHYGILGAAVATSCSLILLRILGSISLYYSLKIIQTDISQIRNIFAGLFTYYIILFIKKIIKIENFYNLALLFVCTCVIFGMIFFLMNKNDKYIDI